MRLHRAGGARLLPAAYGIPWVPEIPCQWRRGTEPGVTAVTNIFGISDDPAPDTPPRETPPPPSGTSDGPPPDPPAGGARPAAAGTSDGPAPDAQPRAARPPAPGISDDP